jgi:hypothetical protein
MVTDCPRPGRSREQPDDLQRRESGIGPGVIQQIKTEWSQPVAILELA